MALIHDGPRVFDLLLEQHYRAIQGFYIRQPHKVVIVPAYGFNPDGSFPDFVDRKVKNLRELYQAFLRDRKPEQIQQFEQEFKELCNASFVVQELRSSDFASFGKIYGVHSSHSKSRVTSFYSRDMDAVGLDVYLVSRSLFEQEGMLQNEFVGPIIDGPLKSMRMAMGRAAQGLTFDLRSTLLHENVHYELGGLCTSYQNIKATADELQKLKQSENGSDTQRSIALVRQLDEAKRTLGELEVDTVAECLACAFEGNRFWLEGWLKAEGKADKEQKAKEFYDTLEDRIRSQGRLSVLGQVVDGINETYLCRKILDGHTAFYFVDKSMGLKFV